MARYDTEAMVNYVLNATDQPNLYYVGHSQGTLTLFSKLALADGFGKKASRVKGVISIAETATLRVCRLKSFLLSRRSALSRTFAGSSAISPREATSRCWCVRRVIGRVTRVASVT